MSTKAATRLRRPFVDLPDFVRRTRLNEKALVALAEAGAFESLAISRRKALWDVRALAAAKDDAIAEAAATSQLSFGGLDQDDAVLWDYSASGHSTRGHPMERFRRTLRSQRVPTAAELARLPHGTRTAYVGQVICRQRPQTASGVTFFTLEDETGFVNLVLWARVFDDHRILAKTSVVLGVQGEVQRAEDAPPIDQGGAVDSSGSHGTVHLVATRLYAPDFNVQHQARSRDFH
ncbi:MAG: OB-fold nucleic acid binding domain-containing protein [Myxococcota bacterium]